MQRGQRSVVARVHRLQHVERLGAAALAHHDPVGPHAQGVRHQVADRHLAGSLGVARARLQAHDMGMLQKPQLGRVLDRDDPLALRNLA